VGISKGISEIEAGACPAEDFAKWQTSNHKEDVDTNPMVARNAKHQYYER